MPDKQHNFLVSLIRTFYAISFLLLILILPQISHGQVTNRPNVVDATGKEWMQITSSPRTSWNVIAQFCPQDGVTPCTGGGINDWVWATDTQVLQLMSQYEPALLTVRAVSGQGAFFSAENFLAGTAFQPTFSFCGTYACGASLSGVTASKDSSGFPIQGFASHDNTNVSIDGNIGVGPLATADETSGYRGTWLWRATGPGALAYDDNGQVANPSGGTAVVNVLANDWIAGVRATTSNVFMLQVSSTNAGVTLDTFDGSVDVSNGVPSGSYTLNYQICSSSNASNCDGAKVTVFVGQYLVDAINDAGSASPSTGGTAVANVLANDRLSTTVQATTANVVMSTVSAPSGISLNATSGSVNVAAGTAFGSYVLVYKICDKTNLANCDQANVSVTVQSYSIDAVNDYVRASSKVGSSPLNVLTNDTFNGTAATTAKVSITQVSAPIAGITLNTSTGLVSIATKTSSGIYNMTYKICEINAPTNCDTAIATIELSGSGKGN
jgi:hypothetical protein